MVGVLDSYSNYPSSNPTEAYHFFLYTVFERANINKKEAVDGPLKK